MPYTIGYTGYKRLRATLSSERYPTVPYRRDRRGGGTHYSSDITEAYTWETRRKAQQNVIKYRPSWLYYDEVRARVVYVPREGD